MIAIPARGDPRTDNTNGRSHSRLLALIDQLGNREGLEVYSRIRPMQMEG